MQMVFQERLKVDIVHLEFDLNPFAASASQDNQPADTNLEAEKENGDVLSRLLSEK